MSKSRLGKLIVILMGAIGLLYIGGGIAHADTVNIASPSVGNVAVSNNNVDSGSAQATTSTSVTSESTNQTTVTASGKHGGFHNNGGAQATPGGTVATATVTTQPAAAPNSEIDATANTNVDADSLPTVAATTMPSDGGGTPLIVPVGTVPPTTVTPNAPIAKVVYYQPRSVVPTMVATDHGTPVAATSNQGGQPKPAVPTMPQGATALVSATVAPSPVMRFHGSLAALQTARGYGLAVLLTLLVALASVGVVSAFLSFLRASGFSTAPRGSSPRFNFAFPVGEFGLSTVLKTNSFFSTPQLLQGGWWYQGGRI